MLWAVSSGSVAVLTMFFRQPQSTFAYPLEGAKEPPLLLLPLLPLPLPLPMLSSLLPAPPPPPLLVSIAAAALNKHL